MDPRVQQVRKGFGLNHHHRFIAGDDAIADKIDGNLQRRLCRALAGPRLEHPDLALLDGELHILHVAIMRFQPGEDILQLREGIRHGRFERGILGFEFGTGLLGEPQGRARAGDDIFALGVGQIFAVDLAGSRGRIARERNASGRCFTAVAEHHRLHGDRCSHVVGDGMQTPVAFRAIVAPGPEHGADRAPELLVGVLWKFLPGFRPDCFFKAFDQFAPLRGRDFRVGRERIEILEVVEKIGEQAMIDAQHHIAVHLDEAPVTIVGEAFVARPPGQSFDGRVIEAQIENGVHHAGHRNRSTRTHSQQKRIDRVSES